MTKPVSSTLRKLRDAKLDLLKIAAQHYVHAGGEVVPRVWGQAEADVFVAVIAYGLAEREVERSVGRGNDKHPDRRVR